MIVKYKNTKIQKYIYLFVLPLNIFSNTVRENFNMQVFSNYIFDYELSYGRII